MKKLLWLLLLAPLFHVEHAQAAAPLQIYCIQSTSTPCNTVSNPGSGSQGDTAWLFSGKTNSNFNFLAPLWAIPAGQYVCNPTGTTGAIGYCTGAGGGGTPGGSSFSLQYNNAGSFGGLLPGGTGTFCINWASLSSSPTLITCPGSGGSGLTSVGITTTSSWLTVTNSPLTVNGTITINPTTGEPQDQFVATPCGTTGPVALRTLCSSDLPASGVSAGTYTAANVTVNSAGVVTSIANGNVGVTSITITAPTPLTATGCSITATGTCALTWTGGQTANQFLATPNGSSGAVGLRAIAAADLPNIPIGGGGTGQTTASGAINALLPSQTGQSGNFLTTNGTTASWGSAAGGGTVVPSGGTVGSMVKFGPTVNTNITNAVAGTDYAAPSASHSISTATTATAAQWATYDTYIITASTTLTLPASSTLSTNAGLFLQTLTTGAVIQANAADTITYNGSTTGTGATVSLSQGAFYNVTTNGSGAIYISGSGPNAQQLLGSTWASPGAIGGTTPNNGVFSSLIDAAITGSTQCTHVNTSGVFSGTGADCGTTKTIATSTAAMGTSAIASGACATAVTSTGTGIATTDVINWGFNGDPTAVTGYTPAATGMLTIIAYPTTNTANFKVCNNTSASITPGAITLNWNVVR